MRESVPFDSARVGDVIEVSSLGGIDVSFLGGSDPLVVITGVGEDRDGQKIIDTVDVNGDRRQTRHQLRHLVPTLSRVGEGCTPTPQGLRDFLATKQLQ